jgi:hypothetical protein
VPAERRALSGPRCIVGACDTVVDRNERGRQLRRALGRVHLCLAQALLTQVLAHVRGAEIEIGEVRSRPRGTVRFDDKGALAGPTLVGLWRLRFRPCAQVSSGPQHLFPIGLPILRKQFHLSREPVLIFPEDIGGRLGIAKMFGRLKRHLHALMTPGKPAVRKFLQTFERDFLVLPELDAYRPRRPSKQLLAARSSEITSRHRSWSFSV